MKKSLSLIVIGASLLLAWSGAQAQKSAGEAVDDTWLHTKVKSSMLGHGGGGVNIEVYQGRVQLAGFIESQSRKDKLLEKVNGVENVAEVLDQLVVVAPDKSAGETIDDNVMTGEVKQAIADSAVGLGSGINVEINRGVVLLSGFVDTDEIRQTAIDATKKVAKVNDVINGMNLKSDS